MRITLDDLRKQVNEGRRQRANQVARAEQILVEHPSATLHEIGDENTGCRFGKSKCRRGMAVKIGHCAQPHWYQL